MPVYSGTLTVGTTPVQVDGNFNQWSHIHIRNNDTTKALFIGNENVTASTGLALDKLATIDFDLPPNDSFHMVAESGNISVSYLRIDH